MQNASFRVPFPHILKDIDLPKEGSRIKDLPVVTDQDLEQGDYIVDKKETRVNPKTGALVKYYDAFRIEELIEKRKARGDWSKWPVKPTFYKAEVTYLGLLPESEIERYLPAQVG